MKLNENFFNRNTTQVAKDLLGKFLVRKIGRKIIATMITETEAYHGPNDLASHASGGLTYRTRIMFGPPGYIYVYMIYGMYCCLNFVTREEGFPAAVLIRGAIQISNLKSQKLNGPGRLCRELKIDRTLNDLRPDNNQLWIEDRGFKLKRSEIKRSKRVGVYYAGPWKEKLWRFSIDPDPVNLL